MPDLPVDQRQRRKSLLPFILLPVLAAFGPVAMFAVVSAAMVVVALDIGILGPRNLEAVNPG